MYLIKLLRPILIVFNVINILLLAFNLLLKNSAIDFKVIAIANVVFFLLYCFTIGLHSNATNHKNPQVVVRVSMMTMLFKMLVIIGAVVVYKYAGVTKINWEAVAISAVLYIVYSYLEIRIVSSLKKTNGHS